MPEPLRIINWPDPLLKKPSARIQSIDGAVRELSAQMLEMMREAHGVGLAAPQVSRNIRMFVMNPTGEPGDDKVIINPILLEADGNAEDEEGCLSLPDIRVQVVRSTKITVSGQDLDGKPVEMELVDFPARVWQHEFDHLNGTMIIDRMGPVARMALKRKLKELEEAYEQEQVRNKKAGK
jgi:peptide deformylase